MEMGAACSIAYEVEAAACLDVWMWRRWQRPSWRWRRRHVEGRQRRLEAAAADYQDDLKRFVLSYFVSDYYGLLGLLGLILNA